MTNQVFSRTTRYVISLPLRASHIATLRSISQISRSQRIPDNDAHYVTPLDMLVELRDDNKQLTANMRETHDLCDRHRDVATASFLENWIDEAERRTWFLFEATRAGAAG